jgi:hypothetical protein
MRAFRNVKTEPGIQHRCQHVFCDPAPRQNTEQLANRLHGTALSPDLDWNAPAENDCEHCSLVLHAVMLSSKNSVL